MATGLGYSRTGKQHPSVSYSQVSYYSSVTHASTSWTLFQVLKHFPSFLTYPTFQAPYRPYRAITMKSILLSLSLLASATVGVLAAEELGIDVTVPVECDRKTRKGDKINVHYRGTLQSNGQQFDASKLPCHWP